MPKLQNIFTFTTIIFSIAFKTAFAGQLPTNDDVANLWRASAAEFDTFISETFASRQQLEYSGRFIDPNDAQNISASAKTASNAMSAILKSQELVRQKIELYEGDDWDELYGKTSLWRTSVAAASQTRRRICVVDYYRAIASKGKQKEELLKKVLNQTNKNSGYSVNEKKLLNIRAEWAISPEKNTQNTIRKLDSLIASSNIDNEVFYQAVIMRIKLSRRTNSAQLNALADSLRNSKLKNNFELLFKLGLLQLKKGGDSIIRSMAVKHPAAAEIAARIVLADIYANAANPQLLSMTLKTKTPPEIKLAAVSAIKERSGKYAGVFEQICKIEKFQSRAVFLAAAESVRSTQPAKAVTYYTASVNKIPYTKDCLIGITRSEIARRCARLAYNMYYKDSSYLNTAKEAIEKYMEIAGDKADEEMTYLYGSITIESGEVLRAEKILSGIVSGGGKFADEAALDLIFCEAENSQPHSPQRKELIGKVKKFIDKMPTSKSGNSEIFDQAQRLYCKLLIEEGGKENAKTVIDILKNAPTGQSSENIILKAAALAETGDLVNAAKTLAAVTGKPGSNGQALAAAIITEILDVIDEYEDSVEDFEGFIANCRNLARYSHSSIKCENQLQEYAKIGIEIIIIAAGKDRESTDYAESLLHEHTRGKDGDIDWMRCRARLCMKQERYAEAFNIWSAIAQARKPLSRSADKPPKWWRAKYYALKSYSKISNQKNNDLPRAIEILKKTNKNIPEFWNKKLTDLYLKSKVSQNDQSTGLSKLLSDRCLQG